MKIRSLRRKRSIFLCQREFAKSQQDFGIWGKENQSLEKSLLRGTIKIQEISKISQEKNCFFNTNSVKDKWGSNFDDLPEILFKSCLSTNLEEWWKLEKINLGHFIKVKKLWRFLSQRNSVSLFLSECSFLKNLLTLWVLTDPISFSERAKEICEMGFKFSILKREPLRLKNRVSSTITLVRKFLSIKNLFAVDTSRMQKSYSN